jgi:hypothetical protein
MSRPDAGIHKHFAEGVKIHGSQLSPSHKECPLILFVSDCPKGSENNVMNTCRSLYSALGINQLKKK